MEKDPITETIRRRQELLAIIFATREAYYKAQMAFWRECEPELTKEEIEKIIKLQW